MNDEINDPIAMLRNELANVTPSAEFASRVRERLADDFEALRAELADLTPSPAFAARVRQGIEQGSSSRFSWARFDWRLIVPAAGLAAAAIAAVILWPRQTPVPTNPTSEIARVEPVAPPAVSSSIPQVARPAPLTLSREPRVQATRSALEATSRDPMLEVITDQPALVRALWARFASAMEPAVVEIDSTAPTGEIAVPAVEVSPVAVKWMVEPTLPPPVGGATPIIRIISSTTERSAK